MKISLKSAPGRSIDRCAVIEFSSPTFSRNPLLGGFAAAFAPVNGVSGASGDSRVATQRGAVGAGEKLENGSCRCGSPGGTCSCSSGKSAERTDRAGRRRETAAAASEPKAANGEPLTEEQKQEVERLKKRDQEVRAHEEAHAAAAGPLAQGGPQYEYTTGPDGKQYAIGGHVKIDTSAGRTPEETLSKAQQIQRAALAPAEPSGQDIQVAAKAAQMAAEAQKEKTLNKDEDSDDSPLAAPEPDAFSAAPAKPGEITAKPGESLEEGSDKARKTAEEASEAASAAAFQNPFMGSVARLAMAYARPADFPEPGTLLRLSA